MSEEKPLLELIESLEDSFNNFLAIIKAIGNQKRLKILIALLTGVKSFNSLKEETKLQKTALSNHLTILIKNSLIEKPELGKYKITQDGDLFIRTFERAYKNSEIWQRKQIEALQRRQFSEMFVESFFGKHQ